MVSTQLQPIKLAYQGFMLPELQIGLDLGYDLATYQFVSHAHADHMPKNPNAYVYCTAATLALIRQRGFSGEAQVLEFGQWIDCGSSRVRLLPAGHILGSAMVHIESPWGSFLYTGDFRTPAAPTSDGFEAPQQVDVLLTEATFGLPIYKWKPHATLFEQIRNEAIASLKEGYTPIFLAYSLGKTQEVLHALKGIDAEIQVHGAGFGLCKIYEDFGHDLGVYEAYDRQSVQGKVLICPASALGAGTASNLKKVRTFYVSGWASLEARRVQAGVDALIPLSDHVDFFELIDFCRSLSPSKVWVTHTPDASVVQHYLAKEGIESSAI